MLYKNATMPNAAKLTSKHSESSLNTVVCGIDIFHRAIKLVSYKTYTVNAKK